MLSFRNFNQILVYYISKLVRKNFFIQLLINIFFTLQVGNHQSNDTPEKQQKENKNKIIVLSLLYSFFIKEGYLKGQSNPKKILQEVKISFIKETKTKVHGE